MSACIGQRLALVLAVAATAVALAMAAWTVVAMVHALTPAPIAGHAIPAPMAVCTEEDGSGPGQEFPCMWTATAQGNRMGSSFVLFTAA